MMLAETSHYSNICQYNHTIFLHFDVGLHVLTFSLFSSKMVICTQKMTGMNN